MDLTPEMSSSAPFILVENLLNDKFLHSMIHFVLDWSWFGYILYWFACILVNFHLKNINNRQFNFRCTIRGHVTLLYIVREFPKNNF